VTAPYMAVGEIALRLGISSRRAYTVTIRKSFPEPTRLTLGRVWSTEDVEAWIREHWER
jgi:predicted DNA-binding transcriptional regulator AlpA